jgi:aminoglycoside 2''-phosphotransferase
MTSSSESELPLDARLVRQLLDAQFPILKDSSIVFLRQGWDNSAWLVDRQWIFRFPRRLARQVWLESELAVLGLLAERPQPVLVPTPVYRGKPGRQYPCRFMGYRRLEGTPGDHFDIHSIERQTTARRLGELLTQLHSIDLESAAANGVQSFESTAHEAVDDVVAMRDTVLPRLPEELVPVCAPFLHGTCTLPRAEVERWSLIHSDLVDEHVLFDAGGRVTGVIDWGDACLSNPAFDFGGLFAWLGADFVRDVLAHYPLITDPAFADEIAFYGRCMALVTYGYSLQGRDTSPADRLHLVRTAFAEST